MNEHEASMKRGAPKALIIGAIIAAVLLAAYLGLCAWVGSQGRIFPNITVAGVSVSGLTPPQAATALEQVVEQHQGSLALRLQCEDWSGALDGADVLIQTGPSIQQAVAVGRTGFITRGAVYLSHQMGATQDIPLTVTPTPQGAEKLEQLLEQAVEQLKLAVVQPTYEVVDDQLTLVKGRRGLEIDREALRTTLEVAVNQGFASHVAGAPQEQTVELSVQEVAPQALDLKALWQTLHTTAKSAELSAQTHEITDHVIGLDFDAQAAQQAFDAAVEGKEILIPLTLTNPKETRESLEAKLFADLLGEASSKVGGSANRKSNVRLSAKACDDFILLPGEEFSYNNTTGSRTAEKGYLSAPVYVGGKTEEEVGGGICQTSSTIYYAILHTTLEVTERRNHMYAVGYVPDGMDATVYYGSTDFKFRNNTEYPVKIVTLSFDQGGATYLKVQLYGTNDTGYTAKPERVVTDVIQPETEYVADASVPRGTQKVDKVQNAYTGRKAQTYRYIYDAQGKLVEKQEMGKSTYRSRPKIILYNPLDGDPTQPAIAPTPLPEEPVPPVVTPEPEPPVPEQPEQPEPPSPNTPEPTPPPPTTPIEPEPAAPSVPDTSSGPSVEFE